ncbi:MAG TPA: transposase, partial [Burkholderiales bacterium]|nr:transposase [Burkholderiales bacterium]
MKKKRFTEEQIIAVLKEAEAGAKVLDLCRKHGISDATFYNWKAKYAGMTVADLRRLKELEAENAKLKRIVADQALDNAALKDLLSRNVWSAPYLQGSRSGDGNSLRKCIRPLASGLRLQPGHDEMRTSGSYQAWYELVGSLSISRLTGRRST